MEDNYDNFDKLYMPIYEENFKNNFVIENGIFKIEHSPANRIELLSCLNDNLVQNFNKFSAKHYDKDLKYFKSSLP